MSKGLRTIWIRQETLRGWFALIFLLSFGFLSKAEANIVGRDTFTDSTNSFIEDTAHNPEVGADWETPAEGIEQWVLQAGGADAGESQEKSGKQNIAKMPTDVGSADMDISVDVQLGTHTDPDTAGGPMGRLPSGVVTSNPNRDGFALQLRGNSDSNGADVYLYSVANNTRTELDSDLTADITDTNFHTLKMVIRGTFIFGYLDGSLVVSANSALYPTDNFCGMLGQKDTADFDNYLCESIDLPGEPGTPHCEGAETPVSGVTVKCPIVKECLINFECKVHSLNPLGSHTWVSGIVSGVHVDERLKSGEAKAIWKSIPEIRLYDK